MIPHSKPSTGIDESRAVARIVEDGHLAQGREVAAFEEECAAVAGWRHGVAVNSGTAALHLALVGLGVGSGDIVAMPSYACAALAQASAWLAATPLPCDIGDDLNLDLEHVPDAATAVIVPHLFGARAKLPRTTAVIEDLAHSFGAPPGRSGMVAMTSFYATKMMTTGEGGMLFTDDTGLAELARDLRDYDNRDDFIPRYAYKMTDMQAALGRVQLRRLPEFIARRAEIAARYDEKLAGTPLQRPPVEETVHFRYVTCAPDRDALAEWLQQQGIKTPRPIYRPLHHVLGGHCPRSNAAHDAIISLPCYPALSFADVDFVIESVLRFFEQAMP